MKKSKFLLVFVFLGIVFSVVPIESKAETVTVTSNTSSGIANAKLTATLDDGTVFGFIQGGSYVYFCGAISQRSELTIPDSIFYSSGRYAVNIVGYNGRCDFDNAKSVTSLILPPTIRSLIYLPFTVKVLHVNNYLNIESYQSSNLTKVLVPEADLASYYGNSNWCNYVLINAEGTEPTKITVHVARAGEFAQLLLEQEDNWYKVNELTVTGNLNTDDLNVFKRMRQLTKLDLSRAVITDIPDRFDGANNLDGRNGFNVLEELSLPEMNSIGQYAFAGCYRLKKITMPKVKTIGYGAFSQLAASQITLPEGITSIGEYAFYRSQLTSVDIPSSVTEISDNCFEYCGNLTAVNIPSSVTKIGYESFRETGLTAVSLPNVQTISGRAFYNCKQLSKVVFAEGLTSFENESFYGCTALTEIDLPSTLLSVNRAFRVCTNIKKVISRAVVPPTHNNYGFILDGCEMTGVKLYVPAMSIDRYRAESGWKAFYTILPLEEKTSNLYVYDNATIDDATEFTDDCFLTMDWRNQNRNGSTQYYCGALDYNGSSVFSMHDYVQYQDLGRSNGNNPYSYDSHFTSLIANGTMRADNVQTTFRTHSTYTWYFISLPYDVKVSDIVCTDGVQFVIRKYSGLNRAQQSGATWLNLTNDSIMHAYEGYILKCNKENADFTLPAINNTNKNKVFEKESVVMPLGEYLSEFEHNRSWNLIGNPYPCYYDTRSMDFTAPITVWNRYYGRYDAYSPVDDAYILHPMQSFFVQRPVDQAAITFDKVGRQKDATVRTLQAAAKVRTAVKADRKVFNVVMSDGSNADRTRVVMNGRASRVYELDKDASKFITDDNASMLVYTVEDGVKYAINERPLENGEVKVGFYAPAEGEFTLSLNTAEKDEVVLIDHEANTETVLTDNYRFNAAAGYHDSRFTLRFGKVTGIGTVRVDNGTVSAGEPYAVYTVDGRLIGNYRADAVVNLAKGIYIIKAKDVKRKIVVK